MYLSASEFALPLFGESLPLEEKATLAREILREETSTSFRLARVKGDVHRKPLTSFVSPKSRALVVALAELVCNEVNVLRYFTWVDYFTLYL